MHSCYHEGDLKSLVENIKEKLGDIYELSARLEISKLQVDIEYYGYFTVFTYLLLCYNLIETSNLALKEWAQYEEALLVTIFENQTKSNFSLNAPFYYSLDIDLRGRTSGTDITNIKIELGEIKSSKVSKAIKKRYRQLLLRKIYVPKTDLNFKAPPKEWKEGINFSSSADYHVDVVGQQLDKIIFQ
ncbi:hypothetical protein C1646_753433 [Rhizophagus diaphanus]|nr:hypothetical protein C1646_753433 [Rhizophagus diaphanus] [Rhizophagus sp. MUCL 43196]